MPMFDGTGPRGMGPMTGRGQGYCAFTIPAPGTGGAALGYAGLGGVPGVMGRPYGAWPTRWLGRARWVGPFARRPFGFFGGLGRFGRGRRIGRGFGFGRGRGRGRWW